MALDARSKKEVLKAIIRDLHRGGDVEALKKRFGPLVRDVSVRYFALRDKAGAYRGTLEVSQDATAIRGLRGERRLLDWGEGEKKSV
jgi:DUF438 domain-containing protein